MARYYRDDYAEALFYFRSDTDKQALWQGEGARILGIAGEEVDRETFASLAEGKLPDGSELVRGPANQELQHRAGWDGTTAAPKSYSMAVVGGGDERLLADFERASDRVIREVERLAQARGGANRNHFHPTGNLTVSSYTHVVNRNEEAHLHRHNVINNFTFDGQANDQAGRGVGGWRALETSEMFGAQSWFTAIVRAEMAKAMRQRGYEITVDKYGCPQIAGISEASQAACSTRSEEVKRTVERIRAKWEKKGRVWTDKLECEASEWAKHQTKKAKSPTLAIEQVRAECIGVCQANGDNLGEVVEKARRREIERTPAEREADAERSRQAVRDALDLASLHLLERESVFSARDLETHALTQYQYAGHFSVDDVRADLERRIAAGLLLSGVGLKGETLYTTKGVLDAEENSILLSWQGRGKAKPLGSALQVSLLAGLADERGKTLNKEQAEAFSYLALSCDQITGFHGKGGAGKTFVFTKLATLAALEGVTTRAFAPTLSAVETLNREGLPAVTLQSFLLSTTVTPPAAPELWLLDEATMVGADDMEAFLRRARAVNARVVLAGDVRQFGSVPAGRSFEQLLRYGLPSVKLTKVIRQDQSPEPVKRAVHLASERETRQALALLDEAGRVYASTDVMKRVAKIAELYSSFSSETLVVVATNQERHELNEAVRSRRKELGEVAANGVSTEVYLKKNLSKASRREARFYDKGDVLRFVYARDKRLTPRVWYRVVGRDLTNNLVTIKDQGGRRFTYNPQENPLIDDVYRTERREFAVGDKVELRGKEKHLGLFAGQAGTVVAADKKAKVLTLKTRNGEIKQVDLARYKTLDYGYASTGHSAQSRTVKNVIVLQTSRHRKEVVNLASFYVATSRTKGELFVVTDDLAELTRKLTREHQKVTALDIVPARRLELSLDPLAAG